VGHSLLTLRVSHGLASSISEIPSRSFKSLSNLQHLDFSNNKICSLPPTSFHFLKRLKCIEFQDNEIDDIPKGVFQVGRLPQSKSVLYPRSACSDKIAPFLQGDIHSSLEEINFAFNRIKNLQTHTFVDLSALTIIGLEDNAIERIERRAFMNMNRLKYINLRGNKIRDIADEAFQVTGHRTC
jgi:Leucine-rich repeat (LRR) protein